MNHLMIFVIIIYLVNIINFIKNIYKNHIINILHANFNVSCNILIKSWNK